MKNVYLVTTNNYDHNCLGIFSTFKKAMQTVFDFMANYDSSFTWTIHFENDEKEENYYFHGENDEYSIDMCVSLKEVED